MLRRGELGAVLQFGQHVGQLDVALGEVHRVGAGQFGGLHAGLADGHAGLAPVQPRLGDGRGIGQRRDAVQDQLLVVELHPICRFVFDAIPQRLKLRAVQHCLARAHMPALISILDLQTPGELLQHRCNLIKLRRKSVRHDKRSIFERLLKRFLHRALGINMPLPFQVFP